MKRGDILLARGPRGAMTKARPCVIVQRDTALAEQTKFTVCPIVTARRPNPLRPLLLPTPATGLRAVSQVEVDWIITESFDRFGPRIGSVDDASLVEIDQALRRWLDL